MSNGISDLAAGILRTILATHSEGDAEARCGIARSLIDLAIGQGRLDRLPGPGVAVVETRSGTVWEAALCLRCAWVGTVGDDGIAGDEAVAHACLPTIERGSLRLVP